MPPTVPINHVLQSAPPTESSNRSPVSSFHAQPYSRPQRACLEHSDLLTGTCPSQSAKGAPSRGLAPRPTPPERGCGTGVQEGRPEGVNDQKRLLESNRWPAPQRRCPRKSDYELFKCSKVNIRYWSWCYRGCWPLSTWFLLCIEKNPPHTPRS